MNRSTFRSALLVLAVAVAAAATGVGAALNAEPAANAQNGNAYTNADSRTTLLTTANSTLLLIDYQPQSLSAAQSRDGQFIRDNVEALAASARALDVPTVLTTMSGDSASATAIPELTGVFINHTVYERTGANAWDDKRIVADIERAGRPKLVIAALPTETALTMPALQALADGYQVYVVTDASAGASAEAHDTALQRLVQAGAVPVTTEQLTLEWQSTR